MQLFDPFLLVAAEDNRPCGSNVDEIPPVAALMPILITAPLSVPVVEAESDAVLE
jgi:hypothetical protein